MNIQHFKIFDKKGSPLNWTPDPYIHLSFNSNAGTNAEGFLIVDTSGKITSAEVTNSGYLYDAATTASYTYAFEGTTINLTPAEASINLIDVTIYNPESQSTKGIGSLNIYLPDSSNFLYPSVSYAAAIFLEPVSIKLVETEHLFIFEETTLNNFIRPYDVSNSTLIFKMIGDEGQIQFFTVNENNAEIVWSDEVTFDTSLYVANTPLTLNIGFRAEQEGVYERTIRMYHKVGDNLYTLADIVVSAEAIGEDERFRDLLSNFGSPDPKDIPHLFKEVDINEDNPDWKILNAKSKHMILEHDKIMPFVGTYKALIHALKWLGYDDIYVREWFKNVKENKKISLIIPFEASDRTQTILMFNADQRKTLKKLNQLSLNYCITRETGTMDVWGTPETENCYSYNLKEVFIKLLSLKQWLERNIIGINCRIVDLTGEGIYFERFKNLVSMTDNIGYSYSVEQNLTPYALDESSELVYGDASIKLSFLELTRNKLSDLPISFGDFVQYVWDPWNPYTYLPPNDPSYLADPSSYLAVSTSVLYPFINFSDVMWRLSVEGNIAGVVDDTLVTNPLFVYENDIRFYNIFDTSSVFYDVSTNLTILLENAYLRDPSIDEWTHSVAYSIYPNPCDNGEYLMESSTGDITTFHGYATFTVDTGSRLQYAYDLNYKVPLLSFKNFKYTNSSNNTYNFYGKEYYLDILDGKVAMNAGKVLNTSDNLTMYINWNYDTSLDEQKITVNCVFESPRMRLSQFDPSVYYWSDPSTRTGAANPNVMSFDNSIYTMHVNRIGEYTIELFAWDEYNTMFYNDAKKTHSVWIKHPTLYTLVDNSTYMGYDASKYLSYLDVTNLIYNNLYPIYDRYIRLQGLSVETDINGNVYVSVPSITYFQDVPEPNTINRFFNLTERIVLKDDSSTTADVIQVDEDYQHFYTNDNVNVVLFDEGKYSLISEVSANIIDASTMILLDKKLPSDFIVNSSVGLYLLNDTYRTVVNPSSYSENNFKCDVSDYQFEIGQLVAIVASHIYNGYSWGSSYRVIGLEGSTHIFDAHIPQFLIDSSLYTIKAKHAFSTYSDFIISTNKASEYNNTFKIYLKDSYCQERYFDNTFVYTNILFDHDVINAAWYDLSLNLVNSPFYYYDKSIWVDTSALVIFKAEYDSSRYMLNQKNIWTARYNDSNDVYFKVFNESVPIVFDQSTNFSISVESYDKYGNLIQTI